MKVGDLVEDTQFGDLGIIVSMRFGDFGGLLYGVYFEREGVIEVYEKWLTLRSRHENR